MKRLSKIFVVTVVLTLILSLAVSIAIAGDVVIKDQTIIKASTRIDKNGSEYVQLIVNEDRSLAGVTYSAGVAVMAFGDNVTTAKTFKEGDKVSCIAAARDFNGNISYTVRQFME